MSLLRALRAYVGLGPDEDYENRYLDDYGDGVDIDLTGRNRGTTREFARSGAADTRRPVAGGRQAGGGVEHGGVTNRSKTSPRLRSHVGEEQPGTVVEPDASSGVDVRLRPEGPHGRGSSAPSRADESDTGEPDGVHEVRPEFIDTQGSQPETNNQGAVVRSIDSARTRPKTVSPDSFADAKTIGDDFKLGTPIVLNLQSLDRDLARRLIDFASGVCYALDGSMEKLAAQVFLLVPDGVEVSESDRLRIEQRGYAR